jgi:hypothetical protein
MSETKDGGPDDRLPDAFPDAPARHPLSGSPRFDFGERAAQHRSALVSDRRLTHEILRT